MCGIAGYIGSRAMDRERMDRCLNRMGSRGPDARGIFQHEIGGQQVCLLHSRLSIIDLDPRANQPFVKGTDVMVLNGELYNYLELKQALAKEGETFRTRSDTEVLLSVIQRYGPGGLDLCEGMWAFCSYDKEDGTLLLARDRFGEKPLFIHSCDHGLYFGSEIPFLFEMMGRPLPVNQRQIQRYLVNGYRSLYKGADTYFEGVEELAAGTMLKTGLKRDVECHRYWEPEFEQDPAMDFEAAVSGVRQRLIESVKLRLRSDVPMAFCMSGGIDSNALISIAKKEFDYDVHGFTIVNTDERYAEEDLVDHVVSRLGIRHQKIYLTPEGFLDKLERMVAYHAAPIATISYFTHWLLMESVADHGYKISISGTAADELFTGYYDHHNMYLSEVADDPELFKPSLSNWQAHIGSIVRNPVLRNPMAFIDNPEERGHLYLNAERFRRFLKDDGFNEGFQERSFCPSLLRNRMLNELFHEVIPVILKEDDLNAMYHSIENRSPFLDRNLFEFCQRIPNQLLIRDGYNKAVLRQAMRGIVPDRILDTRRKVGFNAPIHALMDVKNQAIREQILDDGPLYEIVRKKSVEKLLGKEHLENSESKLLFNIVCTRLFLDQYA